MERIIHGDVLSPILAYMRLNGQHKVILESIPREKENARFSILAYNPVFEIKNYLLVVELLALLATI